MAARRRRANPLVSLGVIALVLIVLVLLIKAVTGGDDYSPRALVLAQDTTKLGRDVAGLRTQLKSVDRLTLFRRLTTWERVAHTQLDSAKKLDPPEDRRVANGYLITSLGLRAQAMHNFNPSVRNALSDRDLQVAASQLLRVMRDLDLADRSYELFASSWPQKAARRPAESRWIADPDDATIGGVTEFVRELRNQQALGENFNLSIVSITVDPKPVGKDGNQDQLPFTRQLGVTVVVKNTGNQTVPAVPVAAILTSESDPEPQTAEGTVGSMKPGEQKSVVLKGVEPTAGGPVNLLRVTVGPAVRERNTLDNIDEYKFVMRKP